MPYSMQDYVAARAEQDYPNATAIWSAIAAANDAYLRRQHKDRFNPDLPAIFPAFMPNSGGDIISSRMEQALGYVEFHWAVTRADNVTEVYPAPEAVEVYARGGYFCRTQARPTPFFRMMTQSTVTRPFWVHLRHPAAACHAAWAATVAPLRAAAAAQPAAAAMEQAAPDPAPEKAPRKGARGKSAAPPPAAPVPSAPVPAAPVPAAQIGPTWPTFFRNRIETFSGWLEDWIAYAEEFPDRAVFSSFDELADINALLTRVFARQGFAVDFSGVPDPFGPGKRPTDSCPDWRADLGAPAQEAIARADALWAQAQALLPTAAAAAPAPAVASPPVAG